MATTKFWVVMREINIGKFTTDPQHPQFIFYDAETGNPITFIKDFDLHVDINGYRALLTRYVKNEKTGLRESTEVEQVRVRELRMEPEEFADNYYGRQPGKDY